MNVFYQLWKSTLWNFCVRLIAYSGDQQRAALGVLYTYKRDTLLRWADPIQVRQQKILKVSLILICLQSLFVDKIREYGDKKSKSGGKLVEATKATEADLQAELDKVIFSLTRELQKYLTR